MFPVEVGKEYDVHHTRKGNFRIRIDKVTGSTIDATITRGWARYISEPDRGPGTQIRLAREFSGLVLTSVDV